MHRWANRRTAALVLLASVAAAVAVLVLGPAGATTSASTGTDLPADAQSARVAAQLDRIPGSDVAPALAVLSKRNGAPFGETDRPAVDQRRATLQQLGLGPVAPAVYSPDGRVVTFAVPLPTTLSDDDNTRVVDQLRDAARTGLPADWTVQVTGAQAFRADLGAVFDGADVRLLLATAGVVALLLLLTYRSPVLWLVPLVVVGTGDQVAAKLIGAIASHLGVDVDAAAAGIASVLVFGAGTDYALLLVARYRDELRRTADRFAAMGQAWRATAPAILASGATVAVSLLCLLVGVLPSNRGLGVAAAIGISVAVVFGLVVLPAAIVLPGRRLFWPFVPQLGEPSAAERTGIWTRLGRLVDRRPVAVTVAGALVLVTLSLAGAGARTGLSAADSFRQKPEAVLGQETLATGFPAGSTQPLTVTSTVPAAGAVRSAAATVPGVVAVAPGPTGPDVAVTTVVPAAAPGTGASDDTIRLLRSRLATLPDADAAVGGRTAETYDVKLANQRDTRVVVPLVLLIVLVGLGVLLRAAVAPVLLVLSTVLSFFAAFGAGWLLFRGPFDFPALDSGVPLLSFLFLVALGVDYNVFLIARAHEDVRRGADTRRAVLEALASTGGVITSAGIVLAAVFAVLGVLPLITLTQIGVIVGIGVLLDTLLVRTILVPALVILTGHRFWWPQRTDRQAPASGRATAAADHSSAVPGKAASRL